MISGCVSSPGPPEPPELTQLCAPPQKKVVGQHSQKPFSSSVGLTCIWGLERGHRGCLGLQSPVRREVGRGAAGDCDRHPRVAVGGWGHPAEIRGRQEPAKVSGCRALKS